MKNRIAIKMLAAMGAVIFLTIAVQASCGNWGFKPSNRVFSCPGALLECFEIIHGRDILCNDPAPVFQGCRWVEFDQPQLAPMSRKDGICNWMNVGGGGMWICIGDWVDTNTFYFGEYRLCDKSIYT
jgi:hypothetical protein